jgi:hypothetical protein
MLWGKRRRLTPAQQQQQHGGWQGSAANAASALIPRTDWYGLGSMLFVLTVRIGPSL